MSHNQEIIAHFNWMYILEAGNHYVGNICRILRKMSGWSQVHRNWSCMSLIIIINAHQHQHHCRGRHVCIYGLPISQLPISHNWHSNYQQSSSILKWIQKATVKRYSFLFINKTKRYWKVRYIYLYLHSLIYMYELGFHCNPIGSSITIKITKISTLILPSP